MLITEYCEGGNLARNLMAGRVDWYRRGKRVSGGGWWLEGEGRWVLAGGWRVDWHRRGKPRVGWELALSCRVVLRFVPECVLPADGCQGVLMPLG